MTPLAPGGFAPNGDWLSLQELSSELPEPEVAEWWRPAMALVLLLLLPLPLLLLLLVLEPPLALLTPI